MLVGTDFLADNHGQFSCAWCHAGDPTGETRALAHVGLVPDPSQAPGLRACSCHSTKVADSSRSLHTTLAGMQQALIDRSGGGDTLTPQMQTVFGNHCARCHASCGNCHVSVPAAAGGGLLAGHRFRRTPSMALGCTACHGSRVGDEYRGQNAGSVADAHYLRGMACTACHTGGEMHGQGAVGAKSRYDVTTAPRCEKCHADDASFQATAAHLEHRDPVSGRIVLACQVCHATTYKHCSSCHTSIDPTTQQPVYEVNAPTFESVMTFKIGRNARQDALHPERWVVVRHVPADPANYDHYGAGLSSTFDARPTWSLATPHNIRRNTPQNADCTAACHGRRELFLAPVDLATYEVEANQGVVVPDDLMPQ